MNYEEFLKRKEIRHTASGFDISKEDLNSNAFEFQKDIVKWSLKKGKSAIFADCGLGKTIMQLMFAYEVCKKTHGNVLIIAPLSVSKQTKREGKKFGIDVNICRKQKEAKRGINITNYEMLEHFNAIEFKGVVLDESSIIKSFSGKLRNEVIEKFYTTEYKLACTATPAPNDFMELGNHAEFLGAMTRSEMLATYFVHDGSDTAKWRLKGHAQTEYWKWVASWAIVLKSPLDLGYEVKGYDLPKLNVIEHTIKSKANDYELFARPAETLQERRQARKESLQGRVTQIADMINGSSENWLVWCDYNDESDLLKKSINNSVEVKGSDSVEHKENAGIEFANGNIKALVSKPSIYGFGMNWQNCNNVAFCGLSDSYEKYYQAIRRCWRFGQDKEVNVHIVISEKEINVLENVKRKSEQANAMTKNMVDLTKEITMSEIKYTEKVTKRYETSKQMETPSWLKGE